MSAQKKNSVPSDEQIRARAYEIYSGRGYEEGHQESDWLQAENELRERYRREYGGESFSLDEPQLQEVSTQPASRKTERASRNRESINRN